MVMRRNPLLYCQARDCNVCCKKCAAAESILITFSTNSWSQNDKKSGEILAFRFVFVVIIILQFF